MARKRGAPGEHGGPGVGEAASPSVPVRVLIVSGGGRQRVRLRHLLDGRVESLGVAHSAEEAREACREHDYDLAVIGRNQPDGCGIELAGELGEAHAGLVTVVVSDQPTMDDALAAMRRGAVDLVDALAPAGELSARILSAAKRAQRSRQREDRVRRLRRLCHQLNSARQEVSGHVGTLCNDLVAAYRDLSTQMDDVSVASELNSLLRQELEIESLLRTLLEFLLAKIGATNAGIFLPSTTGDYSLGAYVNYDCPRETSEVLFDHLADAVAPRYEGQSDVLHLATPAELEERLGEDAHWLGESTAMIVSCCEDDECLAVMVLFRDRRRPFDDKALRLVQMTGRLFGAQLARVIRVHHRHLPESQWGRFDPDEDQGFNDLDLAA